MKRILLLSFALLIGIAGLAQNTTQFLTNRTDSLIRKMSVHQGRSASVFDLFNTSKVGLIGSTLTMTYTGAVQVTGSSLGFTASSGSATITAGVSNSLAVSVSGIAVTSNDAGDDISIVSADAVTISAATSLISTSPINTFKNATNNNLTVDASGVSISSSDAGDDITLTTVDDLTFTVTDQFQSTAVTNRLRNATSNSILVNASGVSILAGDAGDDITLTALDDIEVHSLDDLSMASEGLLDLISVEAMHIQPSGGLIFNSAGGVSGGNLSFVVGNGIATGYTDFISPLGYGVTVSVGDIALYASDGVGGGGNVIIESGTDVNIAWGNNLVLSTLNTSGPDKMLTVGNNGIVSSYPFPVTQTITNGVTATAPSEDAVFDALALEANLASPTFSGSLTILNGTHQTVLSNSGIATTGATAATYTISNNQNIEIAASVGNVNITAPADINTTSDNLTMTSTTTILIQNSDLTSLLAIESGGAILSAPLAAIENGAGNGVIADGAGIRITATDSGDDIVMTSTDATTSTAVTTTIKNATNNSIIVNASGVAIASSDSGDDITLTTVDDLTFTVTDQFQSTAVTNRLKNATSNSLVVDASGVTLTANDAADNVSIVAAAAVTITPASSLTSTSPSNTLTNGASNSIVVSASGVALTANDASDAITLTTVGSMTSTALSNIIKNATSNNVTVGNLGVSITAGDATDDISLTSVDAMTSTAVTNTLKNSTSNSIVVGASGVDIIANDAGDQVNITGSLLVSIQGGTNVGISGESVDILATDGSVFISGAAGGSFFMSDAFIFTTTSYVNSSSISMTSTAPVNTLKNATSNIITVDALGLTFTAGDAGDDITITTVDDLTFTVTDQFESTAVTNTLKNSTSNSITVNASGVSISSSDSGDDITLTSVDDLTLTVTDDLTLGGADVIVTDLAGTGVRMVTVDATGLLIPATFPVTQTITNGVTDTAPSEDAVFDAFALKANLSSPTFSGSLTLLNGTRQTVLSNSGLVTTGATAATFTISNNEAIAITASTGNVGVTASAGNVSITASSNANLIGNNANVIGTTGAGLSAPSVNLENSGVNSIVINSTGVSITANDAGDDITITSADLIAINPVTSMISTSPTNTLKNSTSNSLTVNASGVAIASSDAGDDITLTTVDDLTFTVTDQFQSTAVTNTLKNATSNSLTVDASGVSIIASDAADDVSITAADALNLTSSYTAFISPTSFDIATGQFDINTTDYLSINAVANIDLISGTTSTLAGLVSVVIASDDGFGGGDIVIGSGNQTTIKNNNNVLSRIIVDAGRISIESLTVDFGYGSSGPGVIRFLEDTDDGSNYTEFKATAQAGNISYTLPSTPAPSDGYILSSTTAGVLSWVADATSGGLSGLTTDRVLIATSATTAGDDSSLTFDGTNNAITIGSLRIHSTTSSSVFIGNSAGNFTLTGLANTAVGANAGLALTSGVGNTLIGSNAGGAIDGGGDNTIIGASNFGLLTSGNYNIGIGDNLGALTTGSANILIGHDIDVQSAAGDNQLSIQNIIFGTGNSATNTSISTGSIGIGTASPDRRFHVEIDNANTNTVLFTQRHTVTSSGTPANGIGAGLEFEVETSASNNEIGATMEITTTDVTAASEDFDFVFKLMTAGATAAEKFRFSSLGLFSGTNLKASGLTSGRVPIISTGGLIIDDSHFAFSTSTNTLKIAQAIFIGQGTSSNSIYITANPTPASTAFNTVMGATALDAEASGSENSVFGAGALVLSNGGFHNSAFGATSLAALTTGDNNIAVGWQAGDNISSGSNNMVLGYNIDAPVATSDNQLSIQNIIFGTNNSGSGTTVSTGSVGIGTASPDRRFHVEIDNANTNAVLFTERHSVTSSGTPANGIGAGVEFEVETTGNNNEIGATIEATVTDVTSTSEDFDIVFKTMAAGATAAERARISSSGITVGLVSTATGAILFKGSTSGTATLTTANAAGTPTITLGTVTGTVAITGDKLSAFASTTSAELFGVISNETGGSGVLVGSASPALTGTPTAPTATLNTNTTQIATTEYVDTKVRTLALTSDATVNGTTGMVEITGMNITVGVGTYVFEYYIVGTTTATTTTLKFAVNHTGTTTLFLYDLYFPSQGVTASTGVVDQDQNTTTGQVWAVESTRTKNTTLGPMTDTDATTAILYRISGTMIVTVSGDLELYHGSETAVNTQVMTGTSLTLTKVN